MENFRQVKNLLFVKMACNRMLMDKYNIQLADEKLTDLINKVTSLVETENKNSSLTLNELNNITLSKIRGIYEKYSEKENSRAAPVPKAIPVPKTSAANINEEIPKEDFQNKFLDEDMINFKVRELEKSRQVVPTFSSEINHNQQTPSADEEDNIAEYSASKNVPISFTMTPMVNKTQTYKQIQINSISRNWLLHKERNNINITVAVKLDNHILFADTLCLPSFVADMTPCVTMHISDGHDKISYIFTCSQRNGAWDSWNTVASAESIDLRHRIWSIELYDMCGRKLCMGCDCFNILEIEKNEGGYKIKIPKQEIPFRVGDTICIHTSKATDIYETILQVTDDGCVLHITSNNNINIQDFIDSVILNVNAQFSFMIKYHIDMPSV